MKHFLLITSILLLILISPHLNSQVEDDCFCKPHSKVEGSYVEDGIFVDNCNGQASCDIYNTPIYYTEFSFLTFQTFGLSEIDTGYIDFKELSNKYQDFRERVRQIDTIFNLSTIKRIDGLGGAYGFEIEINSYQTRDSIRNVIEKLFSPTNIFFPNVIFLTSVNTNEESKKEKIFITTTSNGEIIVENIFKKSEIRIIDYLGSEVYKKSLNENNVSANHIITGLPNGFYFIIIDGVFYEKIFISSQ
jgi:hypothetical protein